MDMKASFASALFYVVTTTPKVAQLVGSPLLSAPEAQAWSTVILTVGLLYGNQIARRAKKAVKESKKTN